MSASNVSNTVARGCCIVVDSCTGLLLQRRTRVDMATDDPDVLRDGRLALLFLRRVDIGAHSQRLRTSLVSQTLAHTTLLATSYFLSCLPCDHHLIPHLLTNLEKKIYEFVPFRSTVLLLLNSSYSLYTNI